MSLRKKHFAVIAAAACCLLPGVVNAQGAIALTPESAGRAVFAWVDGAPMATQDLHREFSSIMRSRYYHGRVPDGEMESVMKEAQDKVIDAYLLQREVERQKIEPDQAEVQREIDAYEQRYAGSPEWQRDRASVLPGLRAELERRNRLARLERQVKGGGVTDADVMSFYKARPELFTEPEKIHMSVIMLRIDPGAPRTAWQAALDEAAQITKRLRAGADFGEAARMHSQDASAEKSGDMGYLHRGMLPEVAQAVVDKMKPGDISDPIEVLEGVTVLKLHDRIQPRLRAYEDVSARARDLVVRDREDKIWREYRESLRKSAEIRLAVPVSPQSRQ